MSRTTHHRIPLLALTALGLGAVLVPSAARAEPAQVLQLAKGIGGPDGLGKPLKNASPGTEQSYSAAVPMGDKTYVVTVWMSGDVKGNDRPWELKCSSVEIDKMTGIKLVVDSKQLTYGDGDSTRPANHPALASDGKNIIYVFGSDVNRTNVATYAGVLDYKCDIVAKPIKISNDDNQNEGAPEAIDMGGGNFLTGYLSGGNDVYAVGLTVTGTTITKKFNTKVISPANIGRPVMAKGGPDRALFCSAQGDQRPPEDGIACAWINPINGKVIVPSKIVAASNPNATPKVYMNQPQVAVLDEAKGIFAVGYQESNGAGKNTNTKGANTSHVKIIQATDLGFTMGTDRTAIAASQTHASICSGAFGTTGERVIGSFGAPITGVGVPTLQFAQVDTASGVMNAAITAGTDKLWTVGFYGDSGHLANIYGQNPKTQGRDFLKCIGDIPNPGFGVMGGFMPNVATFFAAPHSGRMAGEPKNALFLSLVPGRTTMPATPQDPTAVTQGPISGGGSSSASGAGSSSGTNMEEPTGGDPPFNPGQPSGCACSVPGDDDAGNGGLALTLALGLALAAAARRRTN